MEKLSLKDLQHLELEIFKYFISFSNELMVSCKVNDIVYNYEPPLVKPGSPLSSI